jgi:ribosomal protein S18 acetylase RimI-like enzyme
MGARRSPMAIEITVENFETLLTYGSVSISFEVDRIFEITVLNPNEFHLSECKLEHPYQKDYDAIPGNGPSNWHECFELVNWGFIVARENGVRIGGAAIAYKSDDVNMLEGRDDLAVLWDLRVSPTYRGRGLGLKIFREVEKWCIIRGCSELKIETQNTNVSACRFYQRQGCDLRAIDRFAYPDLPDEIQMLWYKRLSEDCLRP